MTDTSHMIHLSRILEELDDECLTTDALARRLDADEDEVRSSCLRAAREGRLTLVSYGWNFRYAWASNEAAAEMDNGGPRYPDFEAESWHMPRLAARRILNSTSNAL